MSPWRRGSRECARESGGSLATERLELVGLDPARFGRLWPQQLSGGQRQRVGVARALAASSDLILMDEPFGALDPITRRELQDEFRRLQRRLETTVVLVTHDIREACRMGDRLALMDEGRLVQSGPAAEFLEHPADGFVRDFFREAEAVDLRKRGLERGTRMARAAVIGVVVAAGGHGGASRPGRRGRGPGGARGRAAGYPGHAPACPERIAVGAADVLQTVPSLALLGFLLIVFRGEIGKNPALAALVVYALLPIVKNTILGLRSIDPRRPRGGPRAGDDRLAAAAPGRAAPGRADRAGGRAGGDGRLGRHGDDRRGHRS